jgi:serine/threonine-protein kinase
LQRRLATYSGVLFAALTALNTAFSVLYGYYDEIAPARWRWVMTGAGIGLVALAAIWRLVLARRSLSERALYRIDLFYAFSLGASFAAAAVLSPERRAAGYAVLTETIFAVFLRAFLVPSTGRRTAVAASLSFTPVMLGAFMLAITTELDIPGPPYVVAAVLLAAVGVVLATLGSRLIYELQQKVSAAVQFGQYTLDTKIGEGGIGTVYRAHHVMLRRPTAIKLLRADKIGAEAIARFEREVQHTSQLSHPNTVAVFDYGRSSDGLFYYAMEYLDGLDLEQVVRRHGPLNAGRTIDILVQVCGALQEAHERGIVHRDIKPGNIILCEHGGVSDVAKVVDFGLVKEVTTDAQLSSENLVGTPAYVAPEVITNPHAVSPSADLYALGAVGYFLLAGRHVFDGNNAVELCIQHVTTEPRPISQVALNVPPGLELVIMRCLRKAPEERFASASALADALRAVDVTDWNETAAEQWWATRRATAIASTGMSTQTITIDLAHRS